MSKFVHMELNTSDPDAAQKFYKGVFGWKFQKTPMADGTTYWSLATAEGEGFGGMAQGQPGHPSAWLGYIGVDSVKRTISKVEKRGGRVVMPKTDVPGMGSLAIFADPQGAMFAIWQASTPAGASNEAATEQAAPAKKAGKKKAAKKATEAEPAAEQAAASAPGKKAGKKKATKKATGAEPAAEQAAGPAGKKASKKKTAKKATAAGPAGKKKAAKKTASKK